MGKRKKRRLRKLPILILFLIIISCAYFFFYKKDTVVFDKVKEKIKDAIPEIVQKKVSIVNEDSNSRSYAVMINNVNAAWKYQSGLCNAYMVYSLLVEGGITREMALFKDVKDDIKVMSIRSARHYFIDYVLENDAIYVHWGWSPFAQNDIKSFGINNINGLYYEGSYFLRDKEARQKGVAIEHTGYITTNKMEEASAKFNYRTTTGEKVLLNYSPDSLDFTKQENVIKADHIEIKYSGYYTSKYEYDPKTTTYKKMQNQTEMEDYNGTCNLSYKNIITYQIPYSAISGDKKGRLNATTVGKGEGYLITEGQAVPITWEKSDRKERTIYRFKDGSPLVVNDGLTAIELQPKNQSIKIETKEEENTTLDTKEE